MEHRFDERDLYWLAGLLEGEGSFVVSYQPNGKGVPRVVLKMTDRDVVQRVANLWQSTLLGPYTYENAGHRKGAWVTQVSGRKAETMMIMLYPHMGARRRARIAELIPDQADFFGLALFRAPA